MNIIEALNAYNSRICEINEALPNLDDEAALNAMTLFPAWAAGIDYAADQRIRYEDKLYRCVQAHTSQTDWTPNTTQALWTEVAKPGEEWPEWRQPTGAQDAYSSGYKVSHNDQHWTSNIDGNVWEPGVYGWDLAE